jgi:hypothetical protein
VWVIVLSGVLYLVAKSVGRGASVDFSAYYIAALTVHQRKLLYSVEVHEAVAASAGIMDAPLYAYPPTLAVLMQPLLLFSPDAAALVWFGINASLLVVGLGLLFKQSSIRDYRMRAALLLLPMLFVPVVRDLYLGQLNILMLVLILLAYLAFVRKHPYVCGALLALATWLKVWPIALIGYYLWKREWKVVLGAAFGLTLVGVLTLALGGVKTTVDFFVQELPVLMRNPNPGLMQINLSLPSLFAKMFTSSPYVSPLIENPTLAQWSGQIANLLLVIATVGLCSRRIRLRDREQSGTEFMLVLIAALLIAQKLWEATLTLLLPAYFLIAERMESENNMAWRQIILLVTSIVLINVHRVIWMSAKVLAAGQAIPWFLLVFPTFGTMLIWLVFAVRRTREIKTLKADDSLSELCEMRINL